MDNSMHRLAHEGIGQGLAFVGTVFSGGVTLAQAVTRTPLETWLIIAGICSGFAAALYYLCMTVLKVFRDDDE
jgi:hypothetical protein